MSEETTDKRRVAPLPVAGLMMAEYARTAYVITPPQGVSFEQCLEPAFWAHVGERLRPFDRIEVCAVDGTYFGELLVLRSGHGFAKVQKLQYVELASSGETVGLDDFEIRFTPHTKFRVIRKSDRAVLSENHPDKTAALRWLAENVMSAAA